MDVVEAASRLVDAVLGLGIGVLVGLCTKNWLCTIFGDQRQPTGNVSPTTALRLAEQAQDLAEVVDGPVTMNQRGPLAARISPGRLQRMLDLREVDVGIAVVHQRVQCSSASKTVIVRRFSAR